MNTYYVHNCKCLSCSLHFQVYSDYAIWPRNGAGNPVCPECASDALLRWPADARDGFIYESVPGRVKYVPAGDAA